MRPVPSPGPAAYADHSVASAKVRFRRALALLLMTLVLPGSAQLVAGHRTTGRVALRVWLGLAALVTFVALIAFKWHGFGFWLGTNTTVLAMVRFGLCLLAVGWAFLFLDAWRLGNPLALLQRHRLAMVGINGLLCFSVAGSLLFVSHVVAVQRGFILSMFGDGKVTAAHDGRYNVLLLGGDSGADRWGLRPDSITVASIDASTGRTILFGLPRNMLNFPFAKGSIMAKQFPHGYRCGTTCELNSLATWAADHKPLFRGVANPGVEATAEAVEGITGLKVNYYAMVNLQGFRSLVQAMGGLTLNVRDRIPIGGVGGPITGYLPPGVHKLNGFQTLWFARSRESADDYSRMARQKCVMNAMLQQLSPRLLVTKFEKIATASEQLITTDLPASELGKFAQLALKARSQPVSTVSFVPPLVNTGRPDVVAIKMMVHSAIKRSVSKHALHSKLHSKTGFTGKGGGGTAGTVGGSIGNISQGYAANQSTNLSGSC